MIESGEIMMPGIKLKQTISDSPETTEEPDYFDDILDAAPEDTFATLANSSLGICQII